MLALREPYRAPIVGRRRSSSAGVRVGGSDLGDFYKDDNGHLWRYEVKSGLPFGYVRAVTDAYGGAQTAWFPRPTLPSNDHWEVNPAIDTKAAILGVAEEAGEAAEEGAGGGDGGGDSTRPTSTKPKVPGSSLPGLISKSETPKSTATTAPTASVGAFFIILGAGLVAWKILG